jgi:hypothetical protein
MSTSPATVTIPERGSESRRIGTRGAMYGTDPFRAGAWGCATMEIS